MARRLAPQRRSDGSRVRAATPMPLAPLARAAANRPRRAPPTVGAWASPGAVHHPSAGRAGLLFSPDTLGPSARTAWEAIRGEGESAATRASYASALRYWRAWFDARYARALRFPVPVPTVSQFILDHAEHRQGPRLVTELPVDVDRALVRAHHKARLGAPALATLRHRLAVLSQAHRDAGLTNPCADPGVRALMAQTRRAYAQRGARPRPPAAITREVLEALLATCDPSLRGLRDRALLLFGWGSGGRRRSEVTGAQLRDLQPCVDEHGNSAYLFTLRRSKTNPAAEPRPEDIKPVTGRAALALRAWLDASGLTEGAIFRRVLRGGHVGDALAPAAVRDIVRARCQLAGLPGHYSAHSLRAGFVTEAAHQGIGLAETMAMTSHRSVAAVLVYHRAGGALARAAAHLLDGEGFTADKESRTRPCAP